jgi:alpha-glucosidase
VVLHGLLAPPTSVLVDGVEAAVTEATLETGLELPGVVVSVGLGEVRVNLAPPAEASATEG